MIKMCKKLVAFTLAEVLVTLAIIGVVAALTIPTLVTSYQKKMYVTGLKKSYNNLTNGFQTAMANDGVTKLSDTTLWSKIPDTYGHVYSYDINQEKNKLFFDEFKKNFKLSVAYDSGELPEKYNKTAIKFLNSTNAGEFDFGMFFPDGSLVYFEVYDPDDIEVECNGKRCTSLSQFQETHNTKRKFWNPVGMIQIDINGLKTPNIIGRDIFQFFLGNDGVLYPLGGIDYAIIAGCSEDDLESCDYYWKNENGEAACNSNSEGMGCAGRIMEEGWKMTY